MKILYWNTENKEPTTELILKNIFDALGSRDLIILGEKEAPLSPAFCHEHLLEEVDTIREVHASLSQRIYRQTGSAVKIRHFENLDDHPEEEDLVVSENVFGKLIQRKIKRLSRIMLFEVEKNNQKNLLACLHFPSKRHLDEVSQLQAATNYKRFILHRAPEFEHRIVVVGDFNMNPFDSGMVEPHGFYALGNRDVVKNQRVFQGAAETMMYNPCWGLLGDHHAGSTDSKASGSYYYSGAPSKKLYWHLYDQVIISHSLMGAFDHDSLKLYEDVNHVEEMISSNRNKNTALYSDHLPIIFSLNL